MVGREEGLTDMHGDDDIGIVVPKGPVPRMANGSLEGRGGQGAWEGEGEGELGGSSPAHLTDGMGRWAEGGGNVGMGCSDEDRHGRGHGRGGGGRLPEALIRGSPHEGCENRRGLLACHVGDGIAHGKIRVDSGGEACWPLMPCGCPSR